MVDSGELELSKLGELAAKYGAAPMSDKELDRLDDHDFGLILVASDGSRSRHFPLDKKFEVVMSKAAAVANAERIPSKARNILNSRLAAAARRFLPGMRKKASADAALPSNVYALTPYDEHRLSHASMEKTAEGNFAIQESYNGGDLQRFPIDTSEQLTRRMRRFQTAHPKMHIKYAFEYAKNIAERAETLGVEIPEDSAIYLYKTAALHPQARRNICARLDVAPEAAHSAYLGLMLKTASATPEQLAVSLDSVDREYAMDSWYGVHFPDAASSVLDFRKTAEVWDISGVEVNSDEFRDALENDEEAFSELLDDETVEALKEDPEAVLTSLPVPHRQKVLEMLTERSS
jgi:hypothetical protein